MQMIEILDRKVVVYLKSLFADWKGTSVLNDCIRFRFLVFQVWTLFRNLKNSRFFFKGSPLKTQVSELCKGLSDMFSSMVAWLAIELWFTIRSS